MVEYTNGEVTNEIGDEECPVFLRHRVGRVVDIINGVDPHEAGIVEQVSRDGEGVHEDTLGIDLA